VAGGFLLLGVLAQLAGPVRKIGNSAVDQRRETARPGRPELVRFWTHPGRVVHGTGQHRKVSLQRLRGRHELSRELLQFCDVRTFEYHAIPLFCGGLREKARGPHRGPCSGLPHELDAVSCCWAFFCAVCEASCRHWTTWFRLDWCCCHSLLN